MRTLQTLPTMLTLKPPPELPRIDHSRTNGHLISEEEYWQKYYAHPDYNYEFNNGQLEEKVVSTRVTVLMYQLLQKLLIAYLDAYPIAEMVNLETGFRVQVPSSQQAAFRMGDKKKKKHKGNIRKPDLGIRLHSNPVSFAPTDNRYNGVLDMCIEAISYTTKKAEERDTVEKRAEYELSGVPEYYILDDRDKEMIFLHLNDQGVYEEIEAEDGDIIRSKVLPGFQFRKSDLYRGLSFEELIEDPLYKDFVLPFVQKEKQQRKEAEERAEFERQRAEFERQRAEFERQRAEQEKQRAEQEKQRAEQERQRAEQEKRERESFERMNALLLAKLQKAGISWNSTEAS